MTTSAGILFIDFVSAFAMIARRIAIPDLPESLEAWVKHLSNCGFSDGDVHNIVLIDLTVLDWTNAGCSPHSRALLRETHTACGRGPSREIPGRRCVHHAYDCGLA